MRLASSRCVALETSRGWRIAKDKVSHKIDVIVALAMAALAAVSKGQVRDAVMEYIGKELARMQQGSGTDGLCAKPSCRKPLPDNGKSWTQARGLKFCSLHCSW
jgi:hypothetical protein